MDGARLHALLAEELACFADRFDRIAWLDLSRHLRKARQRDLVPEALHHVSRRPDANRRADLRGVAAIARRVLHVDDVALLQDAGGRARVAEHLCGVRHWGRANDEEVDVASA